MEDSPICLLTSGVRGGPRELCERWGSLAIASSSPGWAHHPPWGGTASVEGLTQTGAHPEFGYVWGGREKYGRLGFRKEGAMEENRTATLNGIRKKGLL